MQRPQEARPRHRSPFAAAFLSLIFPGLGHAYAGAYTRALGFAALPILLVALSAGFGLRMDQSQLIGLVFNPLFLQSVFVINLLLLAYRVVAIVDSYRVAEYLNRHEASGDNRLGPARLIRNPLSIAGLLAVILVMSGVHVVVARYDALALDALTSGCIFVGEDVDTDCLDPEASPSPEATETGSTTDEPTASPTPEATAVGSDVPEVSIPPWDGKERLNILLIGADIQGGGHNTDTLITVSIDPVTKQVAMFSLPRDMTNVPVPAGPARRLWGSVYGQKINSFFVNNRNRSDVWPGKKSVRGYNALKSIIGELYGLDIRYFVEVDFAGFRKVVDSIGGVTVNVQVPVVDDTYPAGAGRDRRLYIPSGLQHMTGSEALRYARSRHTTSDFDRAARQQRLLLSMREQADPQALIPRLPELVAALKKAVKTDIPIDQLDELLGLASQVDTTNISSYVFQPPLYGSETLRGAPIYKMFPNVSRIRSAVRNAFKADPADEDLRERLAEEAATLWVVSAFNDRTRGPELATYLDQKGIPASAPRARAPDPIPAKTKIVVYNGAEADLGDTIAYLEKRFKVTVETAIDPAIRADIILTIGRDTPELKVAPLS
jgi:LCP family protein required for cell wall assembly